MTRSSAARIAVIAPAMLLVSAACSGATRAPARSVPPAQPAPTVPAVSAMAPTAAWEIAERYRVEAITTRRFTHDALWGAIAPFTASRGLRTEEIGRSILGRAIRAVTFGAGADTVLLWSQMHGDESTATMALADIFRFLAEAEGDPLRERLRRELTIVAVPMLNPDGAELFERENAAGIDVNRDARELATPEARALKTLRDRLRPRFGFNLHDQGARTRAGPEGLPAAIALLAPPRDESRGYDDVRARARLVAATVATVLAERIPGRVAKYDDTFNPRAFGDLMQRWGTSTVLIESGALPNDPQKQQLRAVNVAAILTALDAIATGSFAAADPTAYESLAFNTGGASDVLIVGGQLVLPGKAPLRADVAINYDDPVARTGGRIRDVGDLREGVAIDTVQAAGLFLHPDPATLEGRGSSVWLRIGAPARIALRRGAGATSELVRRVTEDAPR